MLFYLDCRDFRATGASRGDGARRGWRGDGAADRRDAPAPRTSGEDTALAHGLATDPKERAEHVMLVDLGRNDLGRVARIGSVQVGQLMAVERYSHVMHLVSDIQAQIAPRKDCFDVLKATFPAGTHSGAPKVRAMEIIAELEPVRRGSMAGRSAIRLRGCHGHVHHDSQRADARAAPTCRPVRGSLPIPTGSNTGVRQQGARCCRPCAWRRR
jgi:anthranilate synthase component 1